MEYFYYEDEHEVRLSKIMKNLQLLNFIDIKKWADFKFNLPILDIKINFTDYFLSPYYQYLQHLA